MIIGEYGLMTNHLIDRLSREKCDVYALVGNKGKEKIKGLRHHTSFAFDPDSSAVEYIMQGVLPDAVIFLGPQNSRYDWTRPMANTQYTADLNNVLIWCRATGVKQFVYLSDMRIFEGDYQMPVKEDQEPKPAELEHLTIYNGEALSKAHETDTMKVTVLRLPIVYGPPFASSERLDPLTRALFDTKRLGKITTPLHRFMPIYVADAVDAIYKVLYKGMTDSYLYHVAGGKVVEGVELAETIKQIYGIAPMVVEGSKGGVALDGSLFAEEFGYRPHMELQEGLQRSSDFVSKEYTAILKRIEEEEKARAREKTGQQKRDAGLVWRQIRNIGENLLLFAVAMFLTIQLRNLPMLQYMDFLMLYMVIIASSFGVGQGVVAAILATGGNIYLRMADTGLDMVSILGQYATIFQFLFYFIVAILISYTIMRSRQAVRESEERMADLQSDYDLIYDMNQINVDLKKVFEDRLLSYDDSIGKIYNIVSELDLLDSEKIASVSVDVVRRVMRVRDVCIYRVAQNENDYCHFVAATTEEARVLDRAIQLSSYPDLKEAMERGDIYVQRSIGDPLPRMAAPIYSGKKLIYVIMLWNIEFEQLNIYQKNLFLVLSKIIASSLEKGYQYETAVRLRNNYGDTDILRPDAFREAREERIAREGAEAYSLIEIDPEGKDLETMSQVLNPLIRMDDKLGQLDDASPMLYLLAHAGPSDVAFVLGKLGRNNVKCRVYTDELNNQ